MSGVYANVFVLMLTLWILIYGDESPSDFDLTTLTHHLSPLEENFELI